MITSKIFATKYWYLCTFDHGKTEQGDIKHKRGSAPETCAIRLSLIPSTRTTLEAQHYKQQPPARYRTERMEEGDL